MVGEYRQVKFESVWAKVSKIPNMFSEENARRLMEIALRCDPGAEFVEIGSYCGCAAAILGLAAMENGGCLTCVDNFSQFNSEMAMASIIPNLRSLGIDFTLMVMDSHSAARVFDRPIDLILVDGDHSYQGCKLDCGLWLPKLKPGGWALFHDYIAREPGVIEVVDSLEGFEDHGAVAYLAVKRKEI